MINEYYTTYLPLPLHNRHHYGFRWLNLLCIGRAEDVGVLSCLLDLADDSMPTTLLLGALPMTEFDATQLLEQAVIKGIPNYLFIEIEKLARKGIDIYSRKLMEYDIDFYERVCVDLHKLGYKASIIKCSGNWFYKPSYVFEVLWGPRHDSR